MPNERDATIGQLAVARGFVSLPQLMGCIELSALKALPLGEILHRQGLLTGEQLASIYHTVDGSTPQQLADEIAQGQTLILERSTGTLVISTVETSEGYTLEMSPSPQLTLSASEGAGDGPAMDLDVAREQRYEFLDELGRGGMGQILRARDRLLNRDIALKTTLADLAHRRSVHDRLIMEAQITGLLEHPSIVPVYDLGALSNGAPFYTMRVVRERSLDLILSEVRDGHDAYSLTHLVSVLRQVCLAIHYAHDHGVIHRDLKPENILVGSYGEVFVIDWGIAKIISEKIGDGSVQSGSKTQQGMIIGTPQYMAPEQARGENDTVDERTDVYALGAILYEILTLTPVFSASHVLALLFKVVEEAPEPPSQRAKGRPVPRELEEICLKALSKDPANRYASAQAMADELNLFLEGIKERERQREQAWEAILEARGKQEKYEAVRDEHSQLMQILFRERQQVPTWAPAHEKEELWRLEHRVEELEIDMERHFGETVRLYGRALGHADLPEARRALADLYWQRFTEAESAGHRATAAYFEGLVRQYNDGHYDTLLEGMAQLSIETLPSDSTIAIFRYEEKNRRLVERVRLPRQGGPVRDLSTAHGSYIVEIQADGYLTARVPVLLGRLQRENLRVRLYSSDAAPADVIVIPGGEFLSGSLQSSHLEENRRFVDDFAIMRYPVTCGEYLDFLNDLAQVEVHRALQHAPRMRDDAPSYFPLNAQGLFELPEEDTEGDAWHPQWPICMVNYEDAQAYAAWRSQKSGHSFRLPTALEWEKSARGVDGRLYPWGNHFDPSFCKMRESERGKHMPAPVGSFPTDRSPYGAMDMAGNISEWTSTGPSDDDGIKILQGAAFSSIALMCRLDWTMTSPTSFRHSHYGFRLVMDLPSSGRS